uniref:Uncharacterized protein n=1 Tax=Triticum urartu TaxID=4572 RepID=A0A8R7PM42_TRIUA
PLSVFLEVGHGAGGPSARDEGAVSGGRAPFSSRCSRWPPPNRGGGAGAGGAHLAPKVAAVEGFYDLDPDLHGAVAPATRGEVHSRDVPVHGEDQQQLKME